MAHRDFAGRSGSKNNKKKAKKSFNRNTLIGLALVVVLGFGLGLYFLKSKTPEPVVDDDGPTRKNTTEKCVAKSS